MAGNNSPSRFLLFIGGIFSFFYIALGALMFMGMFNLFNLEPANQKLLGAAIFAYGIFRLYLFIQRFKQMRNEE